MKIPSKNNTTLSVSTKNVKNELKNVLDPRNNDPDFYNTEQFKCHWNKNYLPSSISIFIIFGLLNILQYSAPIHNAKSNIFPLTQMGSRRSRVWAS
jgi:hypothetical protein